VCLGGGVGEIHLVRRSRMGPLHHPRMIDWCGAVCGMRIDRESRSTRRKSAPVPLCLI
jgi:hypothetical protein